MARFDARDLGSWEQDVAALAGSLVHEIKNPLSTLNINGQLLQEEWQHPTTPREERMVKRLSVMQSEVQRIEFIVNSFLRFTERQELVHTACDVNGLLTDLIGRMREGFERKHVQVRFQPDPAIGTVTADEKLLGQVLANLLSNAEQAMPGGGELIVRTREIDKSRIEVDVTDTGEGIPEERLEKIFRPYYSSKPDGNGLGLPTTLRIVRAHGGNIVVESDAGKGSRFVVSLPREQQATSVDMDSAS
ncbi:MAG: ATP-binding protein [Planctomycetota bacterium]